MSGIVRWFKSGEVLLTKFSPLKSRDGEDEGEDDRDEDDHEIESEPKSSDGIKPVVRE